jgi:hypothetical protein
MARTPPEASVYRWHYDPLAPSTSVSEESSLACEQATLAVPLYACALQHGTATETRLRAVRFLAVL